MNHVEDREPFVGLVPQGLDGADDLGAELGHVDEGVGPAGLAVVALLLAAGLARRVRFALPEVLQLKHLQGERDWTLNRIYSRAVEVEPIVIFNVNRFKTSLAYFKVSTDFIKLIFRTHTTF